MRSLVLQLTCSLLASAASLSAEKPLSLFNGKDLEGFTTWLRDTKHRDPLGVFTVEEGTIRISGEGFGYLATKKRFRDYQLTLEFRWGDQEGLTRGERTGKALDSGVFLHGTGPDGNSHDGKGAYMAAIECNVFEGATGDILLIRGDDEGGKEISPFLFTTAAKNRDAQRMPFWSPEGSRVSLTRWGRVNWRGKSKRWKDVRGFRGAHDVEKPVGEWNTLQCRCLDREITVTLNGKTVNKVSGVFPSEGKILLQCEGAEIYFRNLSLVKLKAAR